MITKQTKAKEPSELPQFNPNRPIAGQALKAVDRETMSHQWQENSPAIDTNVLSDHPNRALNANILTQIDTKENIKAREDAVEAAADAANSTYSYDSHIDPSRRDVSDPLYASPGSERHKAYLKKGK